LYSGIVRYTSSTDSIRILSCNLFTILTLFGTKLFALAIRVPSPIDTSLIIIYSLLVFVGLVMYRTSIKVFFQYSKTARKIKKNVIIFGAGELGIAVKRTFDHDLTSNKIIVGFFDDNPSKVGKAIDGVRIYKSDFLLPVIKKLAIDELIIATPSLLPDKKAQVIETCLENNISVLTIPPAQQIMNGDLSVNQIKNVKIEDLLERAPIKINNESILDQIRGKRVLVTGAAGSIGSEIAKQLSKYEPQLIILCDQAESPLHNLQLDLQEKFKDQIYQTFIADVKNYDRMRHLYEEFNPQIGDHAAAYKHVPMIENQPIEGVKTNIQGTINIANLSVEFKTKKFVFVSTDKAVNPTNVMGA